MDEIGEAFKKHPMAIAVGAIALVFVMSRMSSSSNSAASSAGNATLTSQSIATNADTQYASDQATLTAAALNAQVQIAGIAAGQQTAVDTGFQQMALGVVNANTTLAAQRSQAQTAITINSQNNNAAITIAKNNNATKLALAPYNVQAIQASTAAQTEIARINANAATNVANTQANAATSQSTNNMWATVATAAIAAFA